MSDFKPEVVIQRIAVAEPESPIAVFRSAVPGCVNAVFADTIQSKREIKARAGLVGIYDKTMNLDRVMMDLRAHIRPDLVGVRYE